MLAGNLIEVYKRLQRHLIWIAIGHIVLGKKSIDVRFLIGGDFAKLN